MAKKRPATERLAELQRQREQLALDIKDARREAAAERRQNETKRKILLGSLLRHMVQRGDLSDELVAQRLDEFLTRPSERQLFQLDSEDSEDSTDNQGGQDDTTRDS